MTKRTGSEQITKPVSPHAKPRLLTTYVPIYLRKPYIPLGDGAWRANPNTNKGSETK